MHVAVIGAGAIGTVLAAAGCDSGHTVTVCSRTPIDALVLERDGVDRALPVTVVSDPTGVPRDNTGPADVIWVATKVGDTAATGPWLDRLCGSDTLVAAAQNGLDHRARLLPLVRSEWVVPALAYVAAERVRPGRIVHLGGDRIVAPRGDAEARLADAVSARLVVRGTDDIWTATWRKLLGNLVANPITTLTMRRIGVMSEPGIAALSRGVLQEAVAVGRAEGACLDDKDVSTTLAGTGRFGDQTGSSMLYDRLAGQPLEHQHLTGEVVRRAERHGIPVPLNSAILALLEALDRGRAATTSG
jgi:2-dehydropantoate 2-reductase